MLVVLAVSGELTLASVKMSALCTTEKIIREMNSLKSFIGKQKEKGRDMTAVASKQLESFVASIRKCSDLSDSSQADKMSDVIDAFADIWSEDQRAMLTDAVTNRMLNASPKAHDCNKHIISQRPP